MVITQHKAAGVVLAALLCVVCNDVVCANATSEGRGSSLSHNFRSSSSPYLGLSIVRAAGVSRKMQHEVVSVWHFSTLVQQRLDTITWHNRHDGRNWQGSGAGRKLAVSSCVMMAWQECSIKRQTWAEIINFKRENMTMLICGGGRLLWFPSEAELMLLIQASHGHDWTGVLKQERMDGGPNGTKFNGNTCIGSDDSVSGR